MKCEHCGKNEVTFYYQSNINGKVEEKRLCGECARKLGYARSLAPQRHSLMQELLGGEELMRDFFSPMPRLLGGLDRFFGEDLFDDFFREMPALGSESLRDRPAGEQPRQEELINEAEQAHFSRQRQINALRLEQRRAIEEENFERAAELRDQLRALEKEDEKSE